MAKNPRVSSERAESDIELMCTLEGPEQAEFWPATVRAIAPEGLWLYAASPFSRGTLLKAHLIHAAGGQRLARPGRVTNVWMEDGNGWAVQVRFLEPVDPEEIDALLHTFSDAS